MSDAAFKKNFAPLPVLDLAAQQDQGRVRERQEDSCAAVSVGGHTAGFLIVADGMGGQRGGDVASRAAVETASAALRPILGALYPTPTLRLAGEAPLPAEPFPWEARGKERNYNAEPNAELHALLQHTVEQTVADANTAVRTAAAAIDALDDAGCTFTLAILVGRALYLAHVGDSRAYLWQQAQLRPLTHDHSGAAALVAAGVATPAEARQLPVAHQLYRYLGGTPTAAKPDISIQRLAPGDVLLLCSDGLWDMVPDVTIAQHLLAHSELEEAAAALIAAANAAGGEDNISVVLARIGGDT